MGWMCGARCDWCSTDCCWVCRRCLRCGGDGSGRERGRVDASVERPAMSAPAARLELAHVQQVVHGAVGADEVVTRSLIPRDVIDFSASTNPLGPPARVLAALRELDAAAISRYPDPTARRLCDALA